MIQLYWLKFLSPILFAIYDPLLQIQGYHLIGYNHWLARYNKSKFISVIFNSIYVFTFICGIITFVIWIHLLTFSSTVTPSLCCELNFYKIDWIINLEHSETWFYVVVVFELWNIFNKKMHKELSVLLDEKHPTHFFMVLRERTINLLETTLVHQIDRLFNLFQKCNYRWLGELKYFSPYYKLKALLDNQFYFDCSWNHNYSGLNACTIYIIEPPAIWVVVETMAWPWLHH